MLIKWTFLRLPRIDDCTVITAFEDSGRRIQFEASFLLEWPVAFGAMEVEKRLDFSTPQACGIGCRTPSVEAEAEDDRQKGKTEHGERRSGRENAPRWGQLSYGCAGAAGRQIARVASNPKEVTVQDCRPHDHQEISLSGMGFDD